LQIAQRFTATLSLDPLTNDVELVGREILNHLEAAGVRERRCVVAVPLKWALTAYAKLPELPEADVEGFLQIEAERGFSMRCGNPARFDIALRGAVWRAPCRIRRHPERPFGAIGTGVARGEVKPRSFALGISALQSPAVKTSHGVLALVIGENSVDLQITCGGGVAALRSLEGVSETEGGERILHGDLVAREARITLGQLPAELRDQVKHIRIFGARDIARQLAAEIRSRFEPGGLIVEVVSGYPAEEFGGRFRRRPVFRPCSASRHGSWSAAKTRLSSCRQRSRRGSKSPPSIPRASCRRWRGRRGTRGGCRRRVRVPAVAVDSTKLQMDADGSDGPRNCKTCSNRFGSIDPGSTIRFVV